MPTMLQNWQICSQTNSQGYLATDGSDVRQIVVTSSVIEVGSYYPSLGNNSTKIITDQHNTRLHLNEPNLKTRGGGKFSRR